MTEVLAQILSQNENEKFEFHDILDQNDWTKLNIEI